MPILLQVFYTQFSFFEFSHYRWSTFKGTRILLFILWTLVIVGFVSISRINFTYLLIPVFISLTVSSYILITGQNIEYEIYAAICNTNFKELVEFLSSSFFIASAIMVLILNISIYYYLLKPNKKVASVSYYTPHRAIAMLIIGLMGMIGTYVYARDSLYKTYPLSILFYQKMYYKEVMLFKKHFNNIDYAFNGENKNNLEDELYILIIGEGARKQSMSVYGYDRKTTPYMEQAINNQKFKTAVYDTVAAGISTRLSVPLLLSAANVTSYENMGKTPTLGHIFNAVGYETRVISNQESSGRNSDIIALMLNQLKHIKYLSESDVNRGYDIELIPHIKDSIYQDLDPTLLVIHLMGSHWKYQKRYPVEFSYYSGNDERIDTYDNSIRYTDYIIGLILDIMQSSKRPIFLLYTSDHGQNLNDSGDGNYLHAVKEMTEYEVRVPLFFASNLSFYNRHKEKVKLMIDHSDKRMSHDNISHTLLGLAGIYDDKYYKEEYDISSPGFSQSKRYSLNRRLEAIDVDEYLELKY